MKINLDEFKKWLCEADEYQIVSAENTLMGEIALGEHMLELVKIRKEYLEMINVKNIINGKVPNKLIKTLIVPPEGDCP